MYSVSANFIITLAKDVAVLKSIISLASLYIIVVSLLISYAKYPKSVTVVIGYMDISISLITKEDIVV